ncbi:flagellar biosynthesis anti-sigma factor FlgM [Dyella psychrodurans]|uniref:Negative regulator of flagellin synthesis n=1 Tax=Dyella psychrodurans TaxID=1927960 RepID=A0A370X0E6_9GAMM|nr:flagellar biosynthesis anti-sigma factor FlgM [Dyella psychrodurans]RDS81879.1 flagellar biosynthesis anti-sigma factor FlgM [Dyella psychrodurans]
MNTTISSNGLPQIPLATTNADSSAANQTANTSSSGTSATQANDSVNLTDSARAIHQASSANSPVDTARVEQIKQSLAAGTYKVDPNAIADRLVSLENQVSGK